MTPPRWVFRIWWRAHRLIWELSGGRLGGRVLGLPVLELVTTGRKSGLPRSILINYVQTPTGPAIAGSNAGHLDDPAWVKNLRVDPAARMRREGHWSEVTARFLDGDQWEETWALFTPHGDYAHYAWAAGRHIPIAVLEAKGG